MERLYVLPQDVCTITGKKLRHAQRLLRDLKILLGKEKHQCVSKRELANYLNIDERSFKLDDSASNSSRICVYPEDICRVTGKHLRTAQEILLQLRLLLGKEKHQCITKGELAIYLDIDESLINLD